MGYKEGMVECAICGKEVLEKEPKFILPSKDFNSSSSIPINDRIVCVNCYIWLNNKKNRYRNSKHIRRVKSGPQMAKNIKNK